SSSPPRRKAGNAWPPSSGVCSPARKERNVHPLRGFLSRLRALLNRRSLDHDLSEELQIHLDLLTQENIRRGLPLQEARQAANREFGGLEQTRLRYQDQRGLPFLDHLVQDLRYALRGLVRRPGFAAIAILILALGIGATTAVFSVVDRILFR